MNRPKGIMSPRAEELLIQRALVGLNEEEAAELRDLKLEDDVSFDLAAAAVDLATLPSSQEQQPLPNGLAEHILHAATLPAIAQFPPARGSRPRRSRVSQLGWLAAAACLAVAVGALWYPRKPLPAPAPIVVYRQAPPQQQPTPAEQRAELLRQGHDVAVLKWKATADKAAKGASGDVVWSAAAQRGYMRFSGIAPNDGKRWQYQLWIFDKARDARYPVDGGVFDVPATGEVIVPIAARLHVSQATLFAVTVERPGGVVVSGRQRIVVTASPAAG